jgi:hypothetical protein
MKCIVRRERILKDRLNIFPILLFFLVRADITLLPLKVNLSLRQADQAQKQLC